jgi:hypothetical protein
MAESDVLKKLGRSLQDAASQGVSSMQSNGTVGTYLRYGRSLANSGAAGMRSGRDAYLNGKPLVTVLTQKARASLGLAAIGACAGLLQCLASSRDRRIPKSIAIGAVGSAIGFFAGFTWKTRELTTSMVQGAARNIGSARDEHWLERHPIDYA